MKAAILVKNKRPLVVDQIELPKKLKFTDYAVDKFQANFIYTDKNGETKTRPRAYVPFDVSRHTVLKGLRLFQNQKTKSKTFLLQYWFNGKS